MADPSDLRSGTTLNPEISLLNLIRQEKAMDVDFVSLSSFAKAHKAHET